MSFSIKSNKINDIIIRIRYSENKVNNEEANLIIKLMEYFLKNIDFNFKLKDAFNILKSINSN